MKNTKLLIASTILVFCSFNLAFAQETETLDGELIDLVNSAFEAFLNLDTFNVFNSSRSSFTINQIAGHPLIPNREISLSSEVNVRTEISFEISYDEENSLVVVGDISGRPTGRLYIDGLTGQQSDHLMFFMPNEMDFIQAGGKTLVNTEFMGIQEVEGELFTIEQLFDFFSEELTYVSSVDELPTDWINGERTRVIQVEFEGIQTQSWEEMIGPILEVYFLSIPEEIELFEDPILSYSLLEPSPISDMQIGIVEETRNTISTIWLNHETSQLLKRINETNHEGVLEIYIAESIFTLSVTLFEESVVEYTIP